MTTQTLEDVLTWFLGQGVAGVIPLHGAVHKVQDVLSITFMRAPPFQVQIFVVPPGYIIPEHTHPNVDSFEVYLGGQIRFSLDGKWVVSPEDLETEGPHGTPKLRGKVIRVPPGVKHGGVFGPAGGVFASVQHWLNGVAPHCVGSDYDGVALGPEQAASVTCGKAIVKEHLQPSDAASAEV